MCICASVSGVYGKANSGVGPGAMDGFIAFMVLSEKWLAHDGKLASNTSDERPFGHP